MNKKMIKVTTILALVIMVIFSFAIPSFATDWNTFDMNVTTIESNANDSSGASSSIGRIAGAILNMVRIVAVAVAVIMLIVLAIKYISAAPNDKAEIKKHAVVYIVGAVILFSASGILGIIQKFAGNIH